MTRHLVTAVAWAATLVWLITFTPAPVHAGVIATYQLQGTLAADEPARPELQKVDPSGTSGFTSATVFGETRQVFRFNGSSSPATQGGLVLDATGLGLASHFSLEMIASLDVVTSWRRLVNTLGPDSDYGLYMLNGYLTMYPDQSEWSPQATAGQMFHIVVNNNASSNVVTGYLNGSKVYEHASNYLDVTTDAVRFFLDNGVEYSPGYVGLIRLYDQPLTEAEIATRVAAPFSGLTPVPIPSAVWLFGTGLGSLGLVLRRRRAKEVLSERPHAPGVEGL